MRDLNLEKNLFIYLRQSEDKRKSWPLVNKFLLEVVLKESNI